ncbi:hypothetical protein LEP1GSC042_1512 [Leptospira kirschneri serovar Bim str. PUO 1247]|nr:hypothetical protein LEP1GSC042_1512 [Leptospira kirschneri serovar Bim str. PUO 1247]
MSEDFKIFVDLAVSVPIIHIEGENYFGSRRNNSRKIRIHS